MKRVNYDGQTLVTGTSVANALIRYAVAVARMKAGTTVDIPVLEDNGSVVTHTLVLSSGTSMQIFDIGSASPEPEDDRFPLPDFVAIGGKAIAVSTEDVPTMSVPIRDA